MKAKKKAKGKANRNASAWQINMCVLFTCLGIVDPDRWGGSWVKAVWAKGFTKSETARTKEKIAKVLEVLNE